MIKMYDLIIIGGGPAGLTAGLYAVRYKLKTILIEKDYFAGGQVLKTEYIENYPGFDEPILGQELASKMEKQAVSFGLKIKTEFITSVNFLDKIKIVQTEKNRYESKSVIICAGASPKLLDVPGEKEFIGRGVSYCATCDAPFFKDKIVAVVGGGNTAVEEAVFLTKYAEKVFMIHRRDELRADKIVQEKAFSNKKIKIIWDSIVKKICFENQDDKHIILYNKIKKSEKKQNLDGIFIFTGISPNTKLFQNQIELTKNGFIPPQPNSSMKTNIPGIFAAGDVRDKKLRQIITAAGEGALAAFEANKFITEQ